MYIEREGGGKYGEDKVKKGGGESTGRGTKKKKVRKFSVVVFLDTSNDEWKELAEQPGASMDNGRLLKYIIKNSRFLFWNFMAPTIAPTPKRQPPPITAKEVAVLKRFSFVLKT